MAAQNLNAAISAGSAVTAGAGDINADLATFTGTSYFAPALLRVTRPALAQVQPVLVSTPLRQVSPPSLQTICGIPTRKIAT